MDWVRELWWVGLDREGSLGAFKVRGSGRGPHFIRPKAAQDSLGHLLPVRRMRFRLERPLSLTRTFVSLFGPAEPGPLPTLVAFRTS